MLKMLKTFLGKTSLFSRKMLAIFGDEPKLSTFPMWKMWKTHKPTKFYLNLSTFLTNLGDCFFVIWIFFDFCPVFSGFSVRIFYDLSLFFSIFVSCSSTFSRCRCFFLSTLADFCRFSLDPCGILTKDPIYLSRLFRGIL